MEAKTKNILLIGGGVVVVGVIGYLIYQSKQKAKLTDELGMGGGELTDEEILRLSESGGTGTVVTGSGKMIKTAPSGAGAVATVDEFVTPVEPDKKTTIATWKADKTRIKAICGRRRIFGQGKRDWLACVAKNGGNANDPFYGFDGGEFDGGGNYIEVGEGITDLD
jgi:hypothetical protein